MEGYKTITGIVITVLGMIGISEKLGGPEKLTQFFDVGFQLFGVVMAMYGSWKAHKKIAVLGKQVSSLGGVPAFKK